MIIEKGKDLILKRGVINTQTKQHRIFEVGASAQIIAKIREKIRSSRCHGDHYIND